MKLKWLCINVQRINLFLKATFTVFSTITKTQALILPGAENTSCYKFLHRIVPSTVKTINFVCALVRIHRMQYTLFFLWYQSGFPTVT